MTNAIKLLSGLRRPSLLIRAARHGMADYDRRRGLVRMLGETLPTTQVEIMDALMVAEAEAEARRKSGLAIYSISRHVELLVAIMVEFRRMKSNDGLT